MDDLDELSRSVVRIPVAGPAPNNTLVYVRAQFPPHTEVVPGGLQRWPIFGVTLYRIEGFSQAHADEYRRNTRFSVTAFLNYLKNDSDQNFVVAIDEIQASITTDGTVAINGKMAMLADDYRLVCDFWVSAYILTQEPQPDFTRPIRWPHLSDMVRIQESWGSLNRRSRAKEAQTRKPQGDDKPR